jgi:hypothetical protein
MLSVSKVFAQFGQRFANLSHGWAAHLILAPMKAVLTRKYALLAYKLPDRPV